MVGRTDEPSFAAAALLEAAAADERGSEHAFRCGAARAKLGALSNPEQHVNGRATEDRRQLDRSGATARPCTPLRWLPGKLPLATLALALSWGTPAAAQPSDERCSPLREPIPRHLIYEVLPESACPVQLGFGEGPPLVGRLCAIRRLCDSGRWFAEIRVDYAPSSVGRPVEAFAPVFVPLRHVDAKGFPRRVPADLAAEPDALSCLEAVVRDDGALGFELDVERPFERRVRGVRRLRPGEPVLACGSTQQLTRLRTSRGWLWTQSDRLEVGCDRRKASYGPGGGRYCYHFTQAAMVVQPALLLRRTERGQGVRSHATLEPITPVEVRAVRQVRRGRLWVWAEHLAGSGWVSPTSLALQGPPRPREPPLPVRSCRDDLRRLRLRCVPRSRDAIRPTLRAGVELFATRSGRRWRVTAFGHHFTLRTSDPCIEDRGPVDPWFERQPVQAANLQGACVPYRIHAPRGAPPYELAETFGAMRLQSLVSAAAAGHPPSILLGRTAALVDHGLTGHDLNALLAAGLPEAVLAVLLDATGATAPVMGRRTPLLRAVRERLGGTVEAPEYREACDLCREDERHLERFVRLPSEATASLLEVFRRHGPDEALDRMLEPRDSSGTNPLERWLLALLLREVGAPFSSQIALVNLLAFGALPEAEAAVLGSLRIGNDLVGLPPGTTPLSRRCATADSTTARDLACFLLGWQQWEASRPRLARDAFMRVGATCPTLLARAAHQARIVRLGSAAGPPSAALVDWLRPGEDVLDGLRAEPRLLAAWALQTARLQLEAGAAEGAGVFHAVRAQVPELVEPLEAVYVAQRAGDASALATALAAADPAQRPTTAAGVADLIRLADLAISVCWFPEAARWHARAGARIDALWRLVTRLVSEARAPPRGPRTLYDRAVDAICELAASQPADARRQLNEVLTPAGQRACGRLVLLRAERMALAPELDRLGRLLDAPLARELAAWETQLSGRCDDRLRRGILELAKLLDPDSGALVHAWAGHPIDALHIEQIELKARSWSPQSAGLAPLLTPRLAVLSRHLAAVDEQERPALAHAAAKILRFPEPPPPLRRRLLDAGLSEDDVRTLTGGGAAGLRLSYRSQAGGAAADFDTQEGFAPSVFQGSPGLLGCLVQLATEGADTNLARLVIDALPAYRLFPAGAARRLRERGVPVDWLGYLERRRLESSRAPRCHNQLIQAALERTDADPEATDSP